MHRERMAGVMAMLGFSVVEPIRRTVPSSMAGSSASDCACSTCGIRLTEYGQQQLSGGGYTAPRLTALSCSKAALPRRDIILARLVLPVPGGP